MAGAPNGIGQALLVCNHLEYRLDRFGHQRRPDRRCRQYRLVTQERQCAGDVIGHAIARLELSQERLLKASRIRYRNTAHDNAGTTPRKRVDRMGHHGECYRPCLPPTMEFRMVWVMGVGGREKLIENRTDRLAERLRTLSFSGIIDALFL